MSAPTTPEEVLNAFLMGYKMACVELTGSSTAYDRSRVQALWGEYIADQKAHEHEGRP
jgi:hypothetical protein